MPGTHTSIALHCVFSTKQRFKVISDGWRDDLFGYMGGIIREHKGTLLRAGGIEDHVHLLIAIHPSYAISDTLKLLKGNSSRWINDERKISARFEWQRGYAAFSVSHSQIKSVEKYIARQREHHHEQSFEDEYLAMLNLHAVVYDPRFVFDDEFVA